MDPARYFLRDIFAKHFLTKPQVSNPYVATLLKITCLTKIFITFNSKVNMYCMKDYFYIRMPILMSMPRFPNSRSSGVCLFRMEKKEFAVEMKTLYGLPYFLMHMIRTFDIISNYDNTNLTWYFTGAVSER